MGDESAYSVTVERFTGFGEHYDGMRPSPPEALAELLRRLTRQERLGLVVDLGCGTGLSTRYWGQHAEQVIGVDPTDSMRAQAEAVGGPNITYRKGFSHDTGLPDGQADLVVCHQALHWMEPKATFAEAARLLRPGGVFAACDLDWPPVTGFWEVDQAYENCIAQSNRLERELNVSEGLQRWDKAGHRERIQQSGQFCYTRECLLHSRDEGNAARLVGLVLSQGHIQTLLKHGLGEEELHLDRLREVAHSVMGTKSYPWFWSARVRIGVKA